MFKADNLKDLLRAEIVQRSDGVEVAGFAERLRRAGKSIESLNRAYDLLMARKAPAARERAEPSDLAGIRRCRPGNRVRIKPPPSERILRDRLRSVVLGYSDVAITALADEAFEVNRGLR